MLIALSRANIYLLNILIRIKLLILHVKKIRKRCMSVFFVCLVLLFFVKEFWLSMRTFLKSNCAMLC